MPTELTLDRAHHSIIRDLDATIGRLEDLTAEDWERSTPCTDWNVRELVEHLTGNSHFFGQRLWAVVQARTGAAFVDDIESAPDAGSDELVTRLIHHRNLLNHTLSQLVPHDLEFELSPAEGDRPAMTIALLLNVASAECGIHRFDLESAMGERYAGLATEVVIGADAVTGQQLVATANASGKHPDGPWSIHLIGDEIDHVLTWDGTNWRDEILPDVPVTEIHADDSGIVLFAAGRITVDDVRLRIKGDRTVVAQFKTFVPGP